MKFRTKIVLSTNVTAYNFVKNFLHNHETGNIQFLDNVEKTMFRRDFKQPQSRGLVNSVKERKFLNT